MPRADCCCLVRGLPDEYPACGDVGVLVVDTEAAFVALVDVLGHGREADALATEIAAFLRDKSGGELPEVMQALHEHLKGSRGAVAFLGRLDLPTGLFAYVGIGNISAKVFGPQPALRLGSRDGIVGYMMGTPKLQSVRIAPRDIVLLCSDGIRDNFDPLEFPGIFRGEASDIAETVLQTLAKGNDDASCLVLRYLR
ncbi:MAG: Stage II sporulation protein E (SpoIIE) [Solidesulfovibrio magneticus str. Maddingley MBC34]|uniref:Stage II sporulation protein E (SpoIIE) n=1 Tax=Solidesulfovibrio magneticus str. Maddingley MBC34 TaxID=1206767 RepID=K6HDH7_9BACT|nr:MAG: Stage II sporulation protein E (SpoIIE) [Solidesulfovibrio magneticus str. Maddingley MBC34]